MVWWMSFGIDKVECDPELEPPLFYFAVNEKRGRFDGGDVRDELENTCRRRKWTRQLGDRVWLSLPCGFEAITEYGDARRRKRHDWNLNRSQCWRHCVHHDYTIIKDIAWHISKDRLNNKDIDYKHIFLKASSFYKKKWTREKETKKKIHGTHFFFFC